MIICKTCGKRFQTRSLIVKHLYKAHPEFYKGALEKRLATWTANKAAGKVYSRKGKRKQLVTFDSVKNTLYGSNGSGPKEMTARELVGKLKEQQTFLNNAISLINGLITAQEENIK